MFIFPKNWKIVNNELVFDDQKVIISKSMECDTRSIRFLGEDQKIYICNRENIDIESYCHCGSKYCNKKYDYNFKELMRKFK